MKITFVPQRRDETFMISKAGDVLTINNVAYDFSVIPDGGSLPASATGSDYFCGQIERIAGELRVSILSAHGPNPNLNVAFPAVLINVPDGNVEFPK